VARYCDSQRRKHPPLGIPLAELGVDLVHLGGLVRLPELDGRDPRRLQDPPAPLRVDPGAPPGEGEKRMVE